MPIIKSKSSITHIHEDERVAALLAKKNEIGNRIAAFDAEMSNRRDAPRKSRNGGLAGAIRKVISGEEFPAAALSSDEIVAARAAEFEALGIVQAELDVALADAAFRVTQTELPRHRKLVSEIRDAVVELQRALLAEDTFRRDLAKRGGSTANMPHFGRLAADLGIHGGGYSLARYAINDAEAYLSK
jgi:hypothetical protein